MRAWIPFWLFPVGALGGVVLVSLGSISGDLLATLWGLILFPHSARWLRRWWRDPRGEDTFRDEDSDYWRFTPR